MGPLSEVNGNMWYFQMGEDMSTCTFPRQLRFNRFCFAGFAGASCALLALLYLLAPGAAPAQSTPSAQLVGPLRCAVSTGGGGYRDVPCPTSTGSSANPAANGANGYTVLGTAIGNALACAMFHGPGCPQAPKIVDNPQVRAGYNNSIANARSQVDAAAAQEESNTRNSATNIRSALTQGSDGLKPHDLSADAAAPPPASGAPNDGLALRQLKSGSVRAASLDCIIDGRSGCAPVRSVDVVVLTPNALPVPVEAQQYVDRIPAALRNQDGVKNGVEYYEHVAAIRADEQNKLARNEAALKANPTDTNLQEEVAGGAQQVKNDLKDEQNAKTQLSFYIPAIPQSAATGPGNSQIDGKQ